LLRAAVLSLVLLAIAPAAAEAAPSVSRDPLDPGRLVFTSDVAVGDYRYLDLRAETVGVTLIPDADLPPPTEFWNVTAPDCTQDASTKQVRCTAPVTSFSFVGSEGGEGLGTRDVTFSVAAAGAGGDDFLSGGLGADVIDGGAGEDSLGADRGDDLVVGGIDDDALFGGPGADVLDGSEGRDKLEGQGNVDRIRARDGFADARIDCGPGSDKKERAKVDPADPKPKSC
jgi:RTX calcium-binding nonapeptide repeat (4 copies)